MVPRTWVRRVDEDDVRLEPSQMSRMDGAGTNGAHRSSLYHAIAAQGERPPLLLILDQFEEVFHSSDRDQALVFMQTLQQLVMLDDIFVILTVRADFYADIMESPLWGEIRDHRLEVTALKGDKLREAIIQPAQECGVDVGTSTGRATSSRCRR